MRCVSQRHLPLLHRLQQRALHFCRGAVDFIREDEVAKNRPALRGEHALPWIIDERADEVRRQQVGRELNARKPRANRRAERLYRQRLREPRHAFHQHVAIGEQADEKPLDKVALADDDARDFLLKRWHPGILFLNAVSDVLCIGHGMCKRF